MEMIRPVTTRHFQGGFLHNTTWQACTRLETIDAYDTLHLKFETIKARCEFDAIEQNERGETSITRAPKGAYKENVGSINCLHEWKSHASVD